jgi:hypothetical protein
MHRSLASPLLAAASGAVAASLGSSRATSFTEGSGRVGVFLDDESAAKLHQRFPQFKGSRFVLLEGKDRRGTGVYEPLYGVVTNCTVTGSLSSSKVDAVSEKEPPPSELVSLSPL